jgi:hypothetical protein
MNSEQKKKNERASSNFEEEIPKDQVPKGEKAVRKEEDKDYNKEDANFENAAERKETQEQPVDPIKTPPTDD